MPKPLKRQRLIKKLKKLDFVGPYSGGKHQFMERGELKIFIPNPHRGDLGSKLISLIIRELKISGRDFDDL